MNKWSHQVNEIYCINCTVSCVAVSQIILILLSKFTFKLQLEVTDFKVFWVVYTCYDLMFLSVWKYFRYSQHGKVPTIWKIIHVHFFGFGNNFSNLNDHDIHTLVEFFSFSLTGVNTILSLECIITYMYLYFYVCKHEK